MKDFPSRERLMEMPLSFVRNLDVDTPAEELAIQEVLAARATELLPTGHDAVISGSLDIETPEQEAEVQAMLDRKRGLLQQLVSSYPGASTYVGSPIIDAETIADTPAETGEQPMTEPTTEPAPELTPPELTPTAPNLPPEPEAAPSPEATVGVCAICSGKRGHHRKGCSLYKK